MQGCDRLASNVVGTLEYGLAHVVINCGQTNRHKKAVPITKMRTAGES